MINRITIRLILAAVATTAVFMQVSAEETTPEKVFAPPSAEIVRHKVMHWLGKAAVVDPAKRQQIEELWELKEQQPSPELLLHRTMITFQTIDADAQRLVEACHFQNAPLLPPDAQLLDRSDQDPFFVNNLRLYYGRYLTQRRMYEEGLAVLNRVEVADVVDPATHLFFKAVCQHHLLMKTEGLQTIEQLTKRTEGVPERYLTVATLMQYDFGRLEGQIAR